MYNAGGQPALTSCTFLNNWTIYLETGGGMINHGNATLTDCAFIGNEAGAGAGMYNTGDPVLTNCTFSGNIADIEEHGGGLLNQGNPTLINCTFSGNYAGAGGGGMSNSNFYGYGPGGSPTLINCTFEDNHVDGRGAGMYNSDSAPILSNCKFHQNSAHAGKYNARGGAMFNVGSDPTLI